MANFLDQAGGLWVRGALHGKVACVYVDCHATWRAGKLILFSIITNLLHFGMVIVGLDTAMPGR